MDLMYFNVDTYLLYNRGSAAVEQSTQKPKVEGSNPAWEKIWREHFALMSLLMEQHILYNVIDCRGRHRNGIAIYNAT